LRTAEAVVAGDLRNGPVAVVVDNREVARDRRLQQEIVVDEGARISE
jgi:hypothetical protein